MQKKLVLCLYMYMFIHIYSSILRVHALLEVHVHVDKTIMSVHTCGNMFYCMHLFNAFLFFATLFLSVPFIPTPSL